MRLSLRQSCALCIGLVFTLIAAASGSAQRPADALKEPKGASL